MLELPRIQGIENQLEGYNVSVIAFYALLAHDSVEEAHSLLNIIILAFFMCFFACACIVPMGRFVRFAAAA